MRSAKPSAAITLQVNLLNPASISLLSLCSHLDDSPVSFLHANLWRRVCFLGNLTSEILYFHNVLDSPLFDRFTYAMPSALNNPSPPHTSDVCWAKSYWSLTPPAVQILYPPSLLFLWWMVPVVCSSHCTFSGRKKSHYEKALQPFSVLKRQTRKLETQSLPGQAGLNHAEKSDVSEISDLNSVPHIPYYIFLFTL